MSLGRSKGDFIPDKDNPLDVMQLVVRPPPLTLSSMSSSSVSGSEVNWAQLAQQWIQMRDQTTKHTVDQKHDNGAADQLADEKGEADMGMDDDEQTEAVPSFSSIPPSKSLAGFTPHVAAIGLAHQQPPPSGPANMGQLWYMQQYPGTSVSTTGMNWNNDWQKTSSTAYNNVGMANTIKPDMTKVGVPLQMAMEMPFNRLDEGKRMLAATSGSGSVPEPTIDESKRKVLPAWLREGLEKMEKSKQKQQQQQRQVMVKDTLSKPGLKGLAADMPLDNVVAGKIQAMNSGNESACLGNVKQHITSIDIERESRNTSSVCEDNGNDSHEMEEDADEVTAVTIAKRSCFAIAAKEGKNIEQNPTDLMQAVRRLLTELLLEVTNSIIGEVAQDTLKHMRLKETSVQVVQKKDTLFSITSKLGLAAYEDSSSDEAEQELEQTPVKHNSESITGDRKSDGLNSSSTDDDSDESENELLRTIREKKAEFDKFVKNMGIGFLHEEDDNQDEVVATMKRENVRKKTESSGHNVGQRSPTKQPLPSNGGKGHHKTAECSHKDMGETSDTKIQHRNDKYRKAYSSRHKERTSRFSDNKDRMTLPLSLIASQLSEKIAVDSSCTTRITAGGGGDGQEDLSAMESLANPKRVSRKLTAGEENMRNSKLVVHKGRDSTKHSSTSMSSNSDQETNLSVSSSSRHYFRRSSSSTRQRSRGHHIPHSRHKERRRDRDSEERRSARSRSHKKSHHHHRRNNSSDSENGRESSTRRRSRHSYKTSSKRSHSRSRSRSSNVAKKSRSFRK